MPSLGSNLRSSTPHIAALITRLLPVEHKCILLQCVRLFNKNPVEESETDLPPHNGNELEQQHSSSPANDMMSKDSCASTVLLSCLASEPELEPQSETDHHPSTSFNDTMTAVPKLYYYSVIEISAGIQIEALEGERVTAQQSSSKKKKNEESKEEEKADTRLS
ncbi:LOW QUALITY PROTEIN: hypothetical protein DAPPUDRAFT_271622 [Daphnia pulex]|uniref:Uncharacterized protein n=1 Tax=Daphnia pulex TaxID=6669 RepID=E9I2B5_DAPPU|nr:LOW QUALITY PROTEIN: hypothetical protein DAPPUDRAFT_271622 [Daphnia pulex]|eukprot:EFX61865.1 LOW QUALITY PROTEIN: hypothetical protein DAPPUDRAFT_271622 [Daphnia pulex]